MGVYSLQTQVTKTNSQGQNADSDLFGTSALK